MPSVRFRETKMESASDIFLNEFRCIECKAEFAFTPSPGEKSIAYGEHPAPSFCPNCGRRVEQNSTKQASK